MPATSKKASVEPVCFECIEDACILQNDTAWWNLYYNTFTGQEQEPREAILASLKQGVGLAFRVTNKITTIGLATVHLLTKPAAVFLVYLAIDPEFRKKQIGSIFFDFIYQTGVAKLKEKGYRSVGFVWEITANQSNDPREIEAYNKKINFFEQNGGAILPYKYYQPPINGKDIVPMQVMFRPGDEGVTLEATNPGELIQAIYFEKYAAINFINRQVLHELLQEIAI